MKRKGRQLSRAGESAPASLKKPCKRKARTHTTAKDEAASMLSINSLPDLPFGALFGWLPLGDLLSAQFVCQQWKETAIREAAIYRDSITLCIDGEAENQKTARYLERTVWNLPHAEKLQADDGTPLFPDYVPPSQRPSFNTLLLGTRLENRVLLDGTVKRRREHRQWQKDYSQSFEASLDGKVSQLLSLFPRGPLTLTIVCRSQQSDFLRLLPLLRNWKDRLVTLNLYSSHPRAFDTSQNDSHHLSSLIDHSSNRPLLAALNGLSSLRHLTLDLLGEEGDTLYDRHFKRHYIYQPKVSRQLDLCPDFTFLCNLVSLTFADPNDSRLIHGAVYALSLSSDNTLQVGNSSQNMDTLIEDTWEEPGSQRFLTLHLHPCMFDRPPEYDGTPITVPSQFASLRSLFLNLLHTTDKSIFIFIRYLIRLPVALCHLRLHLSAEHVTIWNRQIDSLEAEECPPLPRLRVLSLILETNKPIDSRLPALFHRLFPSLQVILFTQRFIRSPRREHTQFLDRSLASIRRHFRKIFLSGSSLLLLEARLYVYPDENHRVLIQSKERIWTAQELGLR